MNNEHRLPLGLCKQAFMKISSFIEDIQEIKEDEYLTSDELYEFTQMAEVAGVLGVRLLNIVKKECGEEDFLNEQIDMDEIEQYPEKEDISLLNEEIDI